MQTLIGMNDGNGPLVEVDMKLPEAQEASSGTVIRVIGKGFDDILETLRSIVVPFSDTWSELSKEVEISESTMKLTLGITAEGNFYVAKGGASANLEISLKMTPRIKES
jgi:hypothetical protein